MWHIQPVADENVDGILRELYDQDLENDGYINNTTRAWCYRSEVFLRWKELAKAIRSNLRLRTFELVTLATAHAIGCVY